MPSDIAPQVDVGATTLRGLSAFAPLLAAITADNVAPMAMVQLENLGALFHVSGAYAAQVPDLLQRYSSTRLDRLGMSVGWRKGDSASIMAQSAGGQSIAMVCWFLSNCYDCDDGASILYDLSGGSLPEAVSVCSVAQISSVVDILSDKLQLLGFGNILAQQVIRIHAVYEQLGRSVPVDLYDNLTREAVVELLASFSRALCEEDSIVRIQGIQGMGYIIAIALIMFPCDTRLVVDGFIVQESARVSIILELDTADELSYPVQVQIERKLGDHQSTAVPISVEPPSSRQQMLDWHTFNWTGHLANALQLAFATVGLKCSPDLLTACCDVLLMLAQHSGSLWKPTLDHLLLGNVLVLLGEEPVQRIFEACRITFGVTPSGHPQNLRHAFSRLVDVFGATTRSTMSCVCGRRDISTGWDAPGPIYKTDSGAYCLLHALWYRVGRALERGFLCLFVLAGSEATIRCDLHHFRRLFLAQSVDQVLRQCSDRPAFSFKMLHLDMMSLMQGASNSLACSDGSSTIYPATLDHLSLNIDQGIRYHILSGQLVIKERYQKDLRSVQVVERHLAKRSLYSHISEVVPSSSGQQSAVELTIKEGARLVELRTIIVVEGQTIELDLTDLITTSFALKSAGLCDHNLSDPLSAEYYENVISTSVAAPAAPDPMIAIVQTKGNATAQLFACERGVAAMLQRDCCLTCACQRAMAKHVKMIIVA